jgi:hypothetical protein
MNRGSVRLVDADTYRAVVGELRTSSKSFSQIARDVGGCSRFYVADVRLELVKAGELAPMAPPEPAARPRTTSARAARLARVRLLAADGQTSHQIAAACGISPEAVREFAKRHGIEIRADRMTRHKRIDSNRVLAQLVMDADGITVGAELIVFDRLDRAQLDGWIASLVASRRALDRFIRTLQKETHHNAESRTDGPAENSTPIEVLRGADPTHADAAGGRGTTGVPAALGHDAREKS